MMEQDIGRSPASQGRAGGPSDLSRSTSQPEALVPNASVDSNDYRHTFYGILNKQGEFWTPISFGDEKEAWDYLAKFVSCDRARFGDMLRTHRVVPVRVRLETLASAMSAGTAETAKRARGRSPASPARSEAKGDAQ